MLNFKMHLILQKVGGGHQKATQEIKVMEVESLEQVATFILDHLNQDTIEVHQFYPKYRVLVSVH